MNAEDFFALIHGQGMRAIAFKNPGKGKFANRFYATDAEAANAAQLLTAKGVEVYHGCATFRNEPDPETGKLSRKASKVQELKAFWIDIDVDPQDQKKYSSQAEAAKALGTFVKDLSLPVPLIVSSGSGLHVYWPLSGAVSYDKWHPTAELLKTCLSEYGIAADPTRTADAASVLRPPQTKNYKRGKDVKVIKNGTVTDYATLTTKLSAYASASGLATETDRMGPVPTYVLSDSASNDLHGGFEYARANAHSIRAACGAIRHLADSGGNVSEPAWYYAMGVVSHCDNGRALCHEWSKGHPNYNRAETEAKLDKLEAIAPTTCKVLSEHYPDACNGCPFRDRITSPIKLGYVKSEAVSEATVTEDHDDETETQRTINLAPSGMPDGYSIHKIHGVTGVCRSVDVQQEDGGLASAWVPITEVPFYPIAAIEDEKGEHAMRIRMVYRNLTKAREFNVSNAIIGAGGREVRSVLASRQIPVSEANSKFVADYLRAWMRHQVHNVDSISTYTHMGWHKNSFLLGKTLYKADGGTEEVVPSPNLDAWANRISARGSLSDWVRIVDRLYNVPGQEHLQFLVLCSFAAPLVKLLGKTGGIFVYSHSDTSGVGKTTAERVILSVWGSWDGLETAYGRTTDNAFHDLLGAMSNLPVMIDEMTNIDTRLVSQFIHTISQGQGKNRLTRSAVLNQRAKANWDTIVVGSGNTRLSDKLASIKGNPDAELARIFEFTMPPIKNAITVHESNKLMRELEKCVGNAGVEYAKYLTANKDKVKELIEQCEEKLNNTYNFKSSERYWFKLMVVVTAAHIIAKKLGLVKFDVAAVQSWMGKTLREMRLNVSDTLVDAPSSFSRLYSDLAAEMLITVGDASTAKSGFDVSVLSWPKTKIAGRITHTSSNPNAQPCNEVFWLTEQAVREWCNQQSVSYKQLLEDWQAANIIIGQRRVSLGGGVSKYAALKNVKVLELDFKLASEVTN